MIREHHHLIPNILHFLAGGTLGLVAASLAHHFGWRSADRLPGESRWPACAFCMRLFTWQEVFPFFGWIVRPDTLRLPCPCGLRKGLWSQPLAEMLGFALGVGGIYLAGWTGMAIPLCLGLGLLPAMALIDLHFGIIPDGLNVFVALLGILWIGMSGGDFYMALIVAAAMLLLGLFFAVVYSKWRGREMLGIGDVKFFAAAGLWLHPHNAPWFLAIAGLIGAIIGFGWEKISGNKESPFAPALCLSLAVIILYQVAQM
jgi:leader peptidase (prepilin peptidase)/N-methyltransferase